jgi:hypothetical protein
MVDLEDLWLEREPQNRRGTAVEGNFRRRWARRWPEVLAGRTRTPVALLRMVDTARRIGEAPDGRRSGPPDPGSA